MSSLKERLIRSWVRGGGYVFVGGVVEDEHDGVDDVAFAGTVLADDGGAAVDEVREDGLASEGFPVD